MFEAPKVKRYQAFSDIEPGVWNPFAKSKSWCAVFQTYEWLSTWWEHFGGSAGELFLLGVFKKNKLVGLAPLMITRMRIWGLPTFKVIRFAGTPDSDYLDFLYTEEESEYFFESLIKYLCSHRDDWHIAWLSDIPKQSETGSHLLNQGKYISIREETHTPCPFISLPGTWEEYWVSLSRNMRRNLTRYKRGLQELGHLGFAKVNNANLSEINQAMQEFLRLHESRWAEKGGSGAMTTEQHKAFHMEVAEKLRRHVYITLLKLDGQTISCYYGYDYNGVRGLYLPGMNMKYQKYRTGFLVIENLIRDAINENLLEVDFMRGDEAFKYHFTKAERFNRRYFFSHSRWLLYLFLQIESLAKLKKRQSRHS